jgi:septum site-determining protein MinC
MQVSPSDGALAESPVAAAIRSRATFELKGVMSSLTVLRLRSRDLNLIERQLRAKVTQFPQFFQDAPVVLDVGGLEGGIAGFPLAALVRALHVCRVVPIAVTNVAEADRGAALASGLGIVTLSGRPAEEGEASASEAPPVAAKTPARPSKPTRLPPPGSRSEAAPPPPAARPEPPRPEPAPAPPPARVEVSAPAARLPVVVRQPVRSGQVVYGEKTDLIVLAPVNPGGQLIADGNIHIYAPLRGRAIAGASGYAEARIFCQRLEAELVAINGAYVTFDDIPADRRGRPVQIFVQDGKCVIAPL